MDHMVVGDDLPCYRVVATSRHHDMHTLLYGFLDELLFIFLTDFLVFKELTVIRLDQKNWSIEARGYGSTASTNAHVTIQSTFALLTWSMHSFVHELLAI